MLPWLSVCVRCRFAYGPAGTTATHYFLLQSIQIGFAFLVQLTRIVPDKGLLMGVVVVLRSNGFMTVACPQILPFKKCDGQRKITHGWRKIPNPTKLGMLIEEDCFQLHDWAQKLMKFRFVSYIYYLVNFQENYTAHFRLRLKPHYWTAADDYVLLASRRSWSHARGQNWVIVASRQPDQDCGTVCQDTCANPRHSQFLRDN